MSDKDSQFLGLKIADNQNYLKTKNTNKTRYFLDYLIGYNKNFLLASSSQNGKTTLLQQKNKCLEEQGHFKVDLSTNILIFI